MLTKVGVFLKNWVKKPKGYIFHDGLNHSYERNPSFFKENLSFEDCRSWDVLCWSQHTWMDVLCWSQHWGKFIVLVQEMHPLHWLICHVNTFECMEGMVGRKSMFVSTSEILVQYTGAEFKGPPTQTSHIGTTVWSSTVGCRMTVFELSIEELKNIQHGRTHLKLQLLETTARTNDIIFLCLVFSCQITVRKCIVWQYYYYLQRHIALHIYPNSFLKIFILSKEIFKFILIICERFWITIHKFAILFQYLYHEDTDTGGIPNPLLLVMLWGFMNRWVLFKLKISVPFWWA